jgi:hypothetical protein
MRVGLIALAALVGSTAIARAESCYDLWYQRNAIYDARGFCFDTQLGQETFDNSDCWTKTPKLTRAEQRRVDEIRAEERRRHCKVNQ